MNFINYESENYYILIMINNNVDLNLINSRVQVIGIFSSKQNAEIKMNNLLQLGNNLNPTYTIQGPFTINNLEYNSRRPNSIPHPHPDIFHPDIFKLELPQPDLDKL